jgi:hypothetical protein
MPAPKEPPRMPTTRSSGHVAEHLDELVAEAEEDGCVAAELVDACAQALVAASNRRAVVEATLTTAVALARSMTPK